MRCACLSRLSSFVTTRLFRFSSSATAMIPAAAHAAAVPVSDDRARMRAACAAAGGPGTKEGWAILWREGMTIWDLKGPTPVLYDELTRAVCEGRVQLEQPVLVPGCGSGYDVKGLAEAGFRRVVGMDIAEEAIAAARGVLGSGAAATLLCGDFFTDSRVAPGGFKLVFDYTFFCALPPSLRAAWGQRTAELLAPGGLLLSAWRGTHVRMQSSALAMSLSLTLFLSLFLPALSLGPSPRLSPGE